MKNIIRYIILIIALGCTVLLQANPVIKASFSKNNTCGTDVLPLAVILEYSADQSTQNFDLGNSSIFINYNKDKLSVTSVDNETIGASNNWDICSDVSETGGSQNGFINITLARPNTSPSNIGFTPNASYVVSYIHFEIISGSITDGDIIFNEYFTSFNQRLPNDGTNQLAVEFDNDLSIENSDDVGCGFVCEGSFTGEIYKTWQNQSGYATLYVSNISPSGSYTYLWKNGRTTYNNPSQCIHHSNFVDVTEVTTGCTIRFDYAPTFGNCLTIFIGGGFGTVVIPNIILDGGIKNPRGNGVIIDPPKLGSLAENEITIQPNPTNGLFTISFKAIEIEKATLKIYSLTGKLVKEKSISPNQNVESVDASQLSSGMYLVRIITNGGDKIYSAKLTIAN